MAKEGLVKDYYELILREIQGVLSASYVLMVGLGMLFNYYRFKAFGINIFEYADILEFLIAPFEDIQIILAAVMVVAINIAAYRLDIWMARAYPKSYVWFSLGLSKTKWYNKGRTAVFAILTLIFVWWAALAYGTISVADTLNKPLTRFEFHDGEKLNARVIGKTHDIYFVYTKEMTVTAIPMTGNLKKVMLPLAKSETLKRMERKRAEAGRKAQ